MSDDKNTIESLHQKALQLVGQYKRLEAELLEILQELDEKKGCLVLGYTSTFDYAVKALGLSEAVAYGFVNVSRKAKEVPQLKEEIIQGELTISKALKITSVLTKENAPQWLDLAKTLPTRKLEKEVARVNPKPAPKERARHVTETRVALSLSISDGTHEQFKRAQDLLSQKTQKAASMEETLQALLACYLEKHDPVEKAKRAEQRQAKKQAKASKLSPSGIKTLHVKSFDSQEEWERFSPSRDPRILRLESKQEHRSRGFISRRLLAASTKHQLTRKDQGQCTHIDAQGRRCANKRWLQVHHKTPVSHDGSNALENLTTLCGVHHKMRHLI